MVILLRRRGGDIFRLGSFRGPGGDIKGQDRGKRRNWPQGPEPMKLPYMFLCVDLINYLIKKLKSLVTVEEILTLKLIINKVFSSFLYLTVF